MNRCDSCGTTEDLTYYSNHEEEGHVCGYCHKAFQEGLYVVVDGVVPPPPQTPAGNPSEAVLDPFQAAPQPPAHDDGWRPIETAPKDGSIFDVWLGNASDDDVAFYCTKGTRRSCGWSWEKGKFRPLGGLKVAMPVFEVPTHWMPLPTPPSFSDTPQTAAGNTSTGQEGPS